MIGPKRQHQTDAERRIAYDIATERDGDQCVLAGLLDIECVGAVQRDHRQNRDPFNTTPANLQCLCVAHHQWKTEHPELAERDGLAVRSGSDAANVPVYRWGFEKGVPRLGWWLVTDDAMVALTEANAAELRDIAGTSPQLGRAR